MKWLLRSLERIDNILSRKLGVLRCRRVGRFLVGVVPTVGAFLMVGHCFTLLLGLKWHFASGMVKYAALWFVLLIVLSYAYQFCWVHRAFCVYNWIVSLCIDYQRNFGFGVFLTPMRVIMLLGGIWIFYAFFKQRQWKEFMYNNKKTIKMETKSNKNEASLKNGGGKIEQIISSSYIPCYAKAYNISVYKH